jgi:hypothetical protein
MLCFGLCCGRKLANSFVWLLLREMRIGLNVVVLVLVSCCILSSSSSSSLSLSFVHQEPTFNVRDFGAKVC